MSPQHALVFQALIVPHRSLTKNGIKILVTALTVLSGLIALRFWLLGAWPVALISSVEIPLLIALVAINQHRARASELIMLDAMEFKVVRTDAAGKRREVSLPAAWLRIDLDSSGGAPRVVLSSHGRGCEVGAFLHDPERLSLFDALSNAIHRVKNPRFDNPQLREDWPAG